MKKVLVILLLIMLGGSLFLNGYLYYQYRQSEYKTINFTNANSRETFFTVHNVKEAQQFSKGKGIKVGILDISFGVENHQGLYSGAVDFLDQPEELNNRDRHGYWMALALREVAPEAAIYALNTGATDETEKVEAMVKAIDWAIENDLDILTYSSSPFSGENRKKIDQALEKAVKQGIVTTFIHYPGERNIYPDGFLPDNSSAENADLHIYHYDYNTLIISKFEENQARKGYPQNGGEIPFFSISSTSPVTAGFVAILKGINNQLSPERYKELLIETSYSRKYKDAWGREDTISRVPDLYQAAVLLHSQERSNETGSANE